jgi:hypothetical protein
MKKLSVAFLIGLSALLAHAAPPVRVNKVVICQDIKSLLETITNKYGEQPMIISKHGIMEDVMTVVYLNPQSGTLSIIEMDGEAGCIISVGKETHYRTPKTNSM